MCLIWVCFSNPGFRVFILKILVFLDLSAFTSWCFCYSNIEKKYILYFYFYYEKPQKKCTMKKSIVLLCNVAIFVAKEKIIRRLKFFSLKKWQKTTYNQNVLFCQHFSWHVVKYGTQLFWVLLPTF